MKPPIDLTPLLKAISFAAQRHHGQMRKDRKTPYVAHPMRVATLLAQEFGVRDPDILCAALLHDTIEDTTTDHDDIVKEFGARVAGWVSALTKDKRMAEEARERAYFDGLAAACVEVKLCKLGDTLDNLMDVRGLERPSQEKALAKARHLLELFAPGFPAEWTHALERVRRAAAELEVALPGNP
ncbi:MAG: bifunctional (p)ppGpp synthetase/guanosine-3',5'-bis(diphosphate) 3'-pyrophosphohydrolase [Planctomycetes bacterium]|nr:bifunctional (p)ppGpp synthetase/guanosine-3',5'-bis(diphosphate) 3'-pyrophosphohydrolase [Planctomycetota bacterium]